MEDLSGELNAPLGLSYEEYTRTEPEDIFYSTIHYCQEGIHMALQRQRDLLVSLFPHREADIDAQVALVNRVFVPLPRSQVEVMGDLLLVPEWSKTFDKTMLLGVIADYFPQLLRPEYVNVFADRDQMYYIRSDSITFPSISTLGDRLVEIQQASRLPLSSPLLQIIAVALYVQAPKIHGVAKTRMFMNHVLANTGHVSEDQIEATFSTYANRSVKTIRGHLAYIREAFDVINILDIAAGIDQDKEALLRDIAFLKKEGLSKMHNISALLYPLAKLIGRGDWRSAMLCRDFLMKYLGDSFPAWRLRQYWEGKNIPVYLNLDEVENAVKQGVIQIDMDDIPRVYRRALAHHFFPAGEMPPISDKERKKLKQQQTQSVSVPPEQVQPERPFVIAPIESSPELPISPVEPVITQSNLASVSEPEVPSLPVEPTEQAVIRSTAATVSPIPESPGQEAEVPAIADVVPELPPPAVPLEEVIPEAEIEREPVASTGQQVILLPPPQPQSAPSSRPPLITPPPRQVEETLSVPEAPSESMASHAQAAPSLDAQKAAEHEEPPLYFTPQTVSYINEELHALLVDAETAANENIRTVVKNAFLELKKRAQTLLMSRNRGN